MKSIKKVLLPGLFLLVGLHLFVIPPNGHDTAYWLYRILALEEEITNQGISQYPFFILASSYDFYGYGAPLFYGDVFLILPAYLVHIGMQVTMAYGLANCLLWLLRGAVSYLSARMFLQEERFSGIRTKYAAWFAFFYCFFPYILDLIRVRAALGEVTASIFLPLIVACIYRIAMDEKEHKRYDFGLIIGLTGVVCSHVITTLFVAVGVTVFLLFGIRHLSWSKIARLLLDALCTVGLTAFWLFAFLEQYFTGNGPLLGAWSLSDFVLEWKNWFIPSYLQDFVEIFLLHKQGANWYWWVWGFAYIMITALVIWIFNRKKYKNKIVIWIFTISWILVAVCSSKWLLDLVNPILSCIQFPWRVMTVVALFMSGFLTYSMYVLEYKMQRNILLAVFLASVLLSGGLEALVPTYFHDHIDFDRERDHGWDTLYLPKGASPELCAWLGDMVLCHTDGVVYDWERQERSIVITYENADVDAVFELPLFYYYGYNASLAGTGQDDGVVVGKSDSGLVFVAVNGASQGELRITYEKTIAQRIGKWTSIGTVIIFIAVSVMSLCKREQLRR